MRNPKRSPTKVVTFAHRSTVLVIYVFYGESISTVETQISHYSMTTQFTLKDKVRLRRNEKRTERPQVSLIYLYLDSVSQLEAEQWA